LISQKLAGQELVAREKLQDTEAAENIAKARNAVGVVHGSVAFLALESKAAAAYWSAWRNLPVQFPKVDLQRIPEHWRTFGPRISPLTGSPRLAVNPANAILNYLYAILESEARLAAAALGLDPGLGVLHTDTAGRDSLACDLMEPIRPKVDAYLLDWIKRGPMRREWFFEQRNGNCRLMGSFAAQLSETASSWRSAVAPYAERTSRILWDDRDQNDLFIRQPGLRRVIDVKQRAIRRGFLRYEHREPRICVAFVGRRLHPVLDFVRLALQLCPEGICSKQRSSDE
jgi:hypothetical protein